ncbi:LON peptidase substrate-binding domain-containing protein [Maritalea mediterranea]|uniref:LON peptidase substrate-binding domain-containing protein n=1 Tax=Maritalea mediterranea TaxID=2909667 RepID=A0ABS9E292_9HYPH|nr:LON peptidase substrate-binding domain-containing protein [Maritalea mediterranea]MCF4096898.1 LON peptidase substrate-binding domain-containing protein [Maritalea mediterranea]
MSLPSSIPIFPLEGLLLFPRAVLPLHIFEPRYVAMVDAALKTDRHIGVIQPALEDKESLEKVGTLGRITHFEELPKNRYMIGLTGISRFHLVKERESIDTPFRVANVNYRDFRNDLDEPDELSELDRRRFEKVLKNYAQFAEFELDWSEIKDTETEDLVNSCVMASPYPARERQALLEAATLKERAEMLMALAEVEMSRSDPTQRMQ